MNDKNELLEYIYKSTEIGKKGMIHLLEALQDKDNKIKKDIEKYLEKYEEYNKDCEKIIKKNNYKIKEPGLMTEVMNKMGVTLNVMMDNSDSKVAEIIIQGLTMGTIEMEKRINEYKDEVDKEIIKLAKKVLKFQEEAIEDMKDYL